MKPTKTGTVGIIDAAVAGVSGDKFLGALLDLGASENRLRKVSKVVEEYLPGVAKVELLVQSVERGEIRAKLVTVVSKEAVTKRKAKLLLSSAFKCAKEVGLSDWGNNFVLSTVQTLSRAESNVHGHSTKLVELQELGSADTLVDILGVASAVEELGLQRAEWWGTPVAVGGGVSHFSGRDYSNPPPAVAEILRTRNFLIRFGPVEEELTTPTGAAIMVNLAARASDGHPTIRPEKIGYGAGSRDLKEVANILRLIIGETLGEVHYHDEMVVLETNLDDVTGEVIGHTIERVMSAGARDVTVTPVLMKKSRPGHIITVIVDNEKVEKVAGVLMKETGTLGVREIPVRRHITLREPAQVELKIGTASYTVGMKIAKNYQGRVVRAKPEYEDLKRISDATGLTLRELVSRLKSAPKHPVPGTEGA